MWIQKFDKTVRTEDYHSHIIIPLNCLSRRKESGGSQAGFRDYHLRWYMNRKQKHSNTWAGERSYPLLSGEGFNVCLSKKGGMTCPLQGVLYPKYISRTGENPAFQQIQEEPLIEFNKYTTVEQPIINIVLVVYPGLCRVGGEPVYWLSLGNEK